MRPVFRGDTPTDNNGEPIVFKEYGDARDDLIDRIGDYCSYCEAPLFSPAVEHIQPKGQVSYLEKIWGNFLLGCIYCNSIKNDQLVTANNIKDYLWPDTDNTFFAFTYEKHRSPQIHQQLSGNSSRIALNTLKLTGIDREPGHPKLTKKDRRWIKRKAAWDTAERARFNLSNHATDSMRGQIIDTAISTGFWSVWMTVFQDDADMRNLLIRNFKGTSSDCFDQETKPIPRPGGSL